MRVHHINCGTLCPLGGCLVSGVGNPFSPARLVCHCLLVEMDDGLVLVDTGLGRDDTRQARARLGGRFLLYSRPRCDLEETAFHQVERLGFRPSDVRHVVLTHLDIDHAGGIADFPHAEVHVLDAEHRAAVRPGAPWRYQQAHWAHDVKWRLHASAGETWFGFDAVPLLEGRDDLLLVPLPGHTEGHAAVVLRGTDGWLLHAGDGYFHRHQIATPARAPLGLGALQKRLDVRPALRRANAERLATFAQTHPEVRVFSSHDPVEFAAACASRTAPGSAASSRGLQGARRLSAPR